MSMTMSVLGAEGIEMTQKDFIALLENQYGKGVLDSWQSEEGEEELTRENAALILTKVLGYEGIVEQYKDDKSFKDVTSYRGEIAIVARLGLMTGTGSNQFAPQGKVTKQQAEAILQRLEDKMNLPTIWTHINYAIQSSSQMKALKNYNAVSFGWAQIKGDEAGKNFKLEIDNKANDFKVPQGFEAPIDYAKANGVETYLMVYFENQGDLGKNLLGNKEQCDRLITEIVALTKGLSKDGVARGFDGITIDFEQFYSSELKVPYNTFLNHLSKALKEEEKKLNVAVQPTTYFKGYDYKAIGEVADHVILMAHDFGAKKLSESEMQRGIVTTPLTPIADVYKALSTITNTETGIADKNKIALQISYGSLQWQTKEGKVLNAYAYTPSYDKIWARLKTSGTIASYSTYYQNPYATYIQDEISNRIWYENEKSIEAKIRLAKCLGVQGVSYWRLGLWPDE